MNVIPIGQKITLQVSGGEKVIISETTQNGGAFISYATVNPSGIIYFTYAEMRFKGKLNAPNSPVNFKRIA